MPIDVSIVDDDAGFRESMAVIIGGTEGFRCIGTYSSAENAIQEMPRKWPHVLLADIHLPKMSGICCVSQLKSLRPSLQIIMLTAYMDSDMIFDSLKAGASGYLMKKTPPAKILEAVTDVHNGGAPMSNCIARKVVCYFQQMAAPSETSTLTKRELEILNHLAKGAQYKEIADALGINVLTVRTHLHHVYEKLHVRSRTEAVVKFLKH